MKVGIFVYSGDSCQKIDTNGFSTWFLTYAQSSEAISSEATLTMHMIQVKAEETERYPERL